MTRPLNLHYLLPQPLRDGVLAVNRSLVERCGSEVDLTEHIPHVSLFMGVARDGAVGLLRDALSAQIPTIPRLHVRVSRAYLKPDRPKWAFIDVIPPDPIVSLKHKLLAAVSNLIEPPTWNYPDEVPHITVGYIPASHEVAGECLNTFDYGGEISLTRVQISYMGVRGTCVEPISEHELNGT